MELKLTKDWNIIDGGVVPVAGMVDDPRHVRNEGVSCVHHHAQVCEAESNLHTHLSTIVNFVIAPSGSVI